MKYIIMLALFSFSFSSMAQSVFNNYKYIIVPKKFDNFKKENQYQTSTLVKYQLTQKGFTVVYEGSFPEELVFNRCLGLYAKLNDESSMFNTKVTMSFIDCNSKEVYVTLEGKSKEKEYKKSFVKAITEALNSVDGSNYKYIGKQNNAPLKVSFRNDVKTVPEKSREKKITIMQKATEDDQSYKNLEPKPSSYKIVEPKMDSIDANLANQTLYAQEIKDGYQLVDSSPKIRLRILKTSIKDVFIVEHAINNGVVFKKDSIWYYEYYVSGKLVIEKLSIKF
ncbi:hypothetical protein [uncultured Maribacter sp.]|uniref:hypothetical protein n=1 Tax=uncultured Maribacter sp. TaxID=431308 RepID=UPI002613F1EE|nr:hypothetical protein [uncultured Maribacter sp.]